jgi:metal-responsive CopG/Arc/MetJ family transcriptional regulator
LVGWRSLTSGGVATEMPDIFADVFMPTTVHIPAALLKSVDRRAKALGLSRNRLIVTALERVVSERSGWAPEFLEKLRSVDQDTATGVDELLSKMTEARRSKQPRI